MAGAARIDFGRQHTAGAIWLPLLKNRLTAACPPMLNKSLIHQQVA
jgi:hypothetical protein